MPTGLRMARYFQGGKLPKGCYGKKVIATKPSATETVVMNVAGLDTREGKNRLDEYATTYIGSEPAKEPDLPW